MYKWDKIQIRVYRRPDQLDKMMSVKESVLIN